MGTLCEWRVGGRTFICLATYPPMSVENMKTGVAMTGYQAADWVAPSSPEELLRKIPMATPTSTAMVPVPGHDGCYKFDVEQLQKLPTMDWMQHFEMGRQAAAGEWKPEPGIQQAPMRLPDPDVMPLETIQEVEKMGGFRLENVPERVNLMPLPQAAASSSYQGPQPLDTSGADYAGLWGKMTPTLAQSILDTGAWEGTPITPIQRQVAYDYIMRSAPYGPRQQQLQLEEV